MHIISRELESLFWNKLYHEYRFKPGIDRQNEWIKIPDESKMYHKNFPWTDEQEAIITSFLEELVDEMYAFDWQHDCFWL